MAPSSPAPPDKETRNVRRNAFGDFLRSRREALTPEAGQSRRRQQRRTPGLRREEVAERAGISIDWYSRLEQGRTVMPSVATITALTQALRLNQVESAHLRALARNSQRPSFKRETVPEGLRLMLTHLVHPAYITGQRWDLLAWNDAAESLFGGLTQLGEQERNLLLLVLTAPEMKSLFGEAWEAEGRRMVALFRTTYDLWAGDSAFLELRERLHQRCPKFEGWWDTHEVGATVGVQKLLQHTSQGALRFSTASFQANDDPGLRLVLFTPL